MTARKPFFDSSRPADIGDNVKASAQQIWLAGLGAFSKAQQEGGKLFETLVNDGVSMQRNAQQAAEAKIAEATEKMTSMAQQFTLQASQIGQKASGQRDRLESIFEERVAKALARMGVPQADALAALEARVADLEAQLKAARPTVKTRQAKTSVAKTAATKAAATKTAAVKTPKTKTASKTATKAVRKAV